MNTMLFLRLFAEVDTDESALEIANRIIVLIINFAKAEKKIVQKYWKKPEYYEIFLKLNCNHNIPKDFQNILKTLGSGWEKINKYEGIWNPGDGKEFIIQEVRWAHLEGEKE